VIKVFILGLPRSATTRLYKDVCLEGKKRFNALCIFEPTNNEVVGHIYHGIKHVHDVVGEVPYDYDKIPGELFEKIYRNTFWHKDWDNNVEPKTPFCGEKINEILLELDRLKSYVIVKDVHLWVFGEELVRRFMNCKFLFTLTTWRRYLKSIIKRYRRRPHLLDKAGITKFYRYYNNLSYLDPNNIYSAIDEALFVYERYKKILNKVVEYSNVHLVSYDETLEKEQIDEAVRFVFG